MAGGKRHKWTGEQDLTLIHKLIKYGFSNWEEIFAECRRCGELEGLTKTQIQKHAGELKNKLGKKNFIEFINKLHQAHRRMEMSAGADNGRRHANPFGIAPPSNLPSFVTIQGSTIAAHNDEGQGTLSPSASPFELTGNTPVRVTPTYNGTPAQDDSSLDNLLSPSFFYKVKPGDSYMF